MNERLKQLMLEAGYAAPEIAERAHVLAKLIVKDCLQQCEQVRDDALTQKKSDFLTESGKLLYEGVFGGATNCGFAIQQHFGVEECGTMKN